jgi:hypothetical protein
MLNHVNQTIGCKVTAGVWVAWLVGWLGRYLVSYVQLCMLIVRLFPALFANGFPADWTSHSRGSAPLLSLLCTQSSRELLSLAHPTVFPQFQSKFHLHVSTLLRLHSCSTFEYHLNHMFFWLVINSICNLFQTEITLLAVSGHDRFLPHPARLIQFSVPIPFDSSI